MLYHNKRLHPRRPGEHGDHYNGCVLHEIEEQQYHRNSVSPTTNRCSPTSRYSSMSSLNQRRNRNTSTSSMSNHSTSNSYLTRTPPPLSFNLRLPITSTPKRNSIGDFSNSSAMSNSSVPDSDDSLVRFQNAFFNDVHHSNKVKSKSTICLNTSNGETGSGGGGVNGKRASSVDKRNSMVTFKTYDSPDEIIANLFPDIDYKETTYLRKGHGAAQMAKYHNHHNYKIAVNNNNNNNASHSALGNYVNDSGKTRSYSTSSDNSCNGRDRLYQRASVGGRLSSVERDFANIR